MAKKIPFKHEVFLAQQRQYNIRHPALYSSKLPNLNKSNFLLPEIRKLVLWLKKNFPSDKNG